MQLRGIRDDAAGCRQFGDPRAEAPLRDRDHLEHPRRNDVLFLEQPIEDLLDLEADLPQFDQPDHAPAALQRMKLAARRAQRFAVAVVLLENGALRRDGVQHFARLGEIDVEQLGVESRSVGVQQPLRFLGDRRRGRGAAGGGDRRHRGRQRGGSAGVELGQRGRRLRREVGVTDQLGVVAEVLEPGAQQRARALVGRRVAHFGHERGQRAAKFLDRGLDRVGRVGLRRLRRLTEPPREKRRDQALALGALLLDRFDVEAQPGQRFRKQFQVFVRHHRFGVRVGVDLLLAKPQQPLCIRKAQDLERAPDLLAVLAESRELGALRAVAEERIEHLFHVAKVRLDLAADLGQQQALLRPLRHLVQQRHGRRAGQRTQRARGVEPRQHRLDLLREIRREACVILERAFGEQHARRVFHGERLGNRLRHLVQPLDEPRRQLHQRAVADFGNVLVDGRQRLLQLRQVLRASGRELEPRVLRGRK